MAELNGKVAVITGGASGIGEASVRLFVEEGARVVIADMQRDRGESLAAELGNVARFIQVEVRQEEQVKAAITAAADEWGRLDCIFNNAGFGGVLGPIEDIPVEEFDMSFDVLVKGVFLGMKHAIPLMRKQGSGSIINTGSIAAITAGRGPMVYAACKAAVVHLSKVTAMSVADDSIRVNAICPGYIATPLSTNTVGRPDNLIEERIDGMKHQQPIPRVGRPDDIAQTALYLASDRSSFITGQALVVDGGATTGVSWRDQKEVYKTYYPIKVYNPDRG
ncbi:MAG: Dihydroanticapsin 7-dehydrogenase [Alphaproteobacteria bacterium MarineAlpha4_Bin2]|nr:MAG: Dihydroanticapsin 7-dehydrogenase [Alphaproteobacteria bacterium MarineAlpha4_Bin2]